MSEPRIEVVVCPHGSRALAIPGFRLAGYKHCGRWDVEMSWPLDERAVAELQKYLAAPHREEGS